MKYSKKVEDAYRRYILEKPLDLIAQDSKDSLQTWRDVIQYSLQDYARSVAKLAKSNSLDEFVIHSEGDFDNLAAVIKASIDGSIVEISKNGQIRSLEEISYKSDADYSLDSKFMPNAAYNQFPCDEPSSEHRAQYIVDRHPYIEDLHVGLIGDDDFISMRLAKYPSLRLTVVEKDERIVESIGLIGDIGSRINIHNHDVRETDHNVNLDTFVTDPPYTFNGALSFILCGLSMMGSQAGKEFYVILNPTMMGKRWNRLVSVLSQYGIVIDDINKGVSNYHLPDNFSERERADNFLRSIGVSPDSLSYSSNSTMYTFVATRDIDISAIRSSVNPENIYEHYR